jgi:hypothetical protein
MRGALEKRALMVCPRSGGTTTGGPMPPYQTQVFTAEVFGHHEAPAW